MRNCTVSPSSDIKPYKLQCPEYRERLLISYESHATRLHATEPYSDNAATQTTNDLISNLADFYKISNKSKIKRFLDEHQSVAPILLEAVKYIKKIFPQKTTASLELFEFLDEEGGYRLSVVLKNKNYEDEMYKYLDEFDDTWWLSKSKNFCGEINFDI